jgi:hypothetical protein
MFTRESSVNAQIAGDFPADCSTLAQAAHKFSRQRGQPVKKMAFATSRAGAITRAIPEQTAFFFGP